MSSDVWPGRPFPLGREWDGEGTNFSLFSENAERVELCLFDEDGERGAHRAHRAHRVQLALLPARRRARAALRLPRARAVRAGGRASASTRRKLLIDPYAKAIDGAVDWDAANVAAVRAGEGATPT